MTKKTQWPRWVALVAAVGLLSVSGAAAAGLVARQAAAAPKIVTVTEKEWSIVLSRRHLAPGTYKFVIRNKGKITHSFAISSSTSKHEVKGLLKPGASKTLTVTLKTGRYSAYCPIPGHANAGMRAAFVVGSPPPASSTRPASTTASVSTTTTQTTTSSGGSPSPPWG